MKRTIALLLLLASALACRAQSVTLEECQTRARENYPLVEQRGLIDKLEEFNISNARRNWLPKVSLSAMAAYVSEMPEFPASLGNMFAQLGIDFGGSMPNTLYGGAVQVQQAIWDGGLIKAQSEAAKAEAEVSRRSWDADMYALRERVNQLYFGALLLQENIRTADMLIADLERNCKTLEAMVELGVAGSSDLDKLRVELLGARQQRSQLDANRRAYMAMLGIMTGMEFTAATTLEKPVPDKPAAYEPERPEFALFDAQEGLLEAQRRAVNASVMPQIGAFVTGVYSSPSPNIFASMDGSREWSPYLFAGISLKWNIDGFYTKKNRMQQIELNRRKLDMQREVFRYNLHLKGSQEMAAIEQMEEVMRYDDSIIELRNSIRLRTEAQVETGDASVNDLLDDISAEDRARQNKTAHEVEWLKNIYDLKYTINR